MYFTCGFECVYIFLGLHYKQYLCCWNGSTTSGGQVLYSILSTLKKKNPLGFIFPASAILLWCCSEICFHQADSIRELGNEKSAIELDEERRGCGVGRGETMARKARRDCREENGNSYSKWAYTSSFLYLLDFIIRYFRDNSVEGNKVIVAEQKAESFWFLMWTHLILKYEGIWKYSNAGATI